MEDDLIKGGLPGLQPKSNVKFNQYAGYVNVDEKEGKNCKRNVPGLESPAGVGFSYSNTSSDYALSGDKAEDAYRFLVNWFKRFPHFKGRDFYIMGESYAGFYVPELADIIGNGIMNAETDEKGQMDYLWSHALISDETHLGLQQIFGKIDPYNIYGPLCSLDHSNSSSSTSTRVLKKNGYDPCGQHYVSQYLNLPHVQKALHANLPNPWDSCSGDVDAVVSVTSTRYSISAMNRTVIKPWHFWHDDTKEVAGYMVVYDGLAFATVRGAGHQVPQFQPRRAFALLNMSLANHF
ncbi:unnamed protein product [Withania somnifera]